MNDEMERTDDLELTWEIELDVLEAQEGDVPDYVKQTIQVPRMTTRRMIRYRKALVENFGPILMAGDDKNKQRTAIINENMTPDRMGEILIDMLLPGLLDRLHPDSFDLLTDRIMEVEKKVLNPLKTTEKKGAKRKSKSGKGTRKR